MESWGCGGEKTITTALASFAIPEKTLQNGNFATYTLRMYRITFNKRGV
jgi:hypothetical protein